MNDHLFDDFLTAIDNSELSLEQYETLFAKLHQHFAWTGRAPNNRRYKPLAIAWRMKQAQILTMFANGKSPVAEPPPED